MLNGEIKKARGFEVKKLDIILAMVNEPDDEVTESEEDQQAHFRLESILVILYLFPDENAVREKIKHLFEPEQIYNTK